MKSPNKIKDLATQRLKDKEKHFNHKIKGPL